MSFLKSFAELTQLLSTHPELLEPSIVVRGERLLSIYCDPRYENGVTTLQAKLLPTLEKNIIAAAEDFSAGAVRLSRQTAATYLMDGKFIMAWTPLGEAVTQPLVFKISLRQRSAFANWRKEVEAPELNQDEINSGVYVLAKTLSNYI